MRDVVPFVLPRIVNEQFRSVLLRIHAKRVEDEHLDLCLREAYNALAASVSESVGKLTKEVLEEDIPRWIYETGRANRWFFVRSVGSATTTENLEDVKTRLAGRIFHWLAEIEQPAPRPELLRVSHDRSDFVPFDTPPDAAWSDVEIRFLDGHTVSVSVKGRRKFLTYAQMGMASQKDANPTVQWKALQAFATAEGALRWENSQASPKMKKRVQNLSKDLRTFFRISGSPFAEYEKGVGWRAKFRVHPER